jgi:DNA-binding HxlR family transcriptional regulator
MSQQIEKTPGCMQEALKILGDKWTALILMELSSSSSTFSQLEVALSGISPRTLSQRLNKLESEDIVSKNCYCEHPPRYQYQITQKGKDLQSVLKKMADWGAKYA